MAEPILRVENLCKTYTSFKKKPGLGGALRLLARREANLVAAVKNLSFAIDKGEFVGLLGPNGAGKTTTLKMLTGLIPPSSGQAIAFSQFDTSQRKPAYLSRIAMVMGQRNQLHPDLPALDSFKLAQAIFGIEQRRFLARVDQCAELFAAKDLLLVPVRKLSLGERMKMELILAILHEPELLFLDEPTIGLDFQAARQIRRFLLDTNRQLGITVILTSHYSKDIEELCRRVLLINHGQLVFDGPLSGVDERIQGQKLIQLTFKNRSSMTATLELLQGDGIAATSETQAQELSFFLKPVSTGPVLSRLFTKINPEDVIDFKVTERTIDDIFSEIYSRPVSP